MEESLRDRVAIVVGGTGLIGKVVAEHLAESGARIVLAGRDQERLTAFAEKLGTDFADRIQTVRLDVTDSASVGKAISEAAGFWGRLDILVNAAGVPARQLEVPADETSAVLAAIDGKALGQLRCIRAAEPFLKASNAGRVLNIGGQLAHVTGSLSATLRNQAVAVVSKSLADELSQSGVTVNVIHPGPITNQRPVVAPEPGRPGETTAGQVAALIAFLASDQAASVSGASIDVGHSVWGVMT